MKVDYHGQRSGSKPLTRSVAIIALGFLPLIATTKAQDPKTDYDPKLIVETGHTSAISSVAFLPNGKILVSGGADNMVKLWDVGTGRELLTLRGHTGAVNSVAVSSDGKFLASASDDNTIKLWDTNSGRESRVLRGHTDDVSSVTFSPDGNLLASGSKDNTARIWDVGTGRELQTLRGHADWINSVAFSTDGRTLASGSNDRTIRLWNTATGQLLLSLRAHTSYVTSVAFSPDGEVLASGSTDNTVKLWKVTNGQVLRTLLGHTASVESVAFSFSGVELASGSLGGEIKLWNLKTEQEPRSFQGETDHVSSIAFSSDDQLLASGSRDNIIKLWDVGTGQELRTLRGHAGQIDSVAFSPDCQTLAAGGDDKNIKLWDLKTGRKLRLLRGHTDAVEVLAFSLDGKMLASGGLDNTVKVWDVESGQVVRTFRGHTNPPRSLAFSSDGHALGSESLNHIFKLWEVRTGRELLTMGDGAGLVSPNTGSIWLSQNRKLLARGTNGGSIGLWDMSTGRKLRTLRAHNDAVELVEFDRPGKRFASTSTDGAIMLWDIATGKLLRTLRGHPSQVYSLAFSRDGETLASGGKDNSVRVWKVATGQELYVLRGHRSPVTSIALSPDGKTLASGGDFFDLTINLWDLVTGRKLNSFDTTSASTSRQVFSVVPELYSNNQTITRDGAFQIKYADNYALSLYDFRSGALLASLVSLDEDDWVATSLDNHFDTNKDLSKKIEGLHWILPEDPFSSLPLEVFMRDYFEPNLLQRIADGETLPQVRDLAKLNIAQPRVQITAISLPDLNNEVTVSVVAENGERDVIRSGQKLRQLSGVYDLHLFRDGQLVKVAPDNSAAELSRIPADYDLEKEIPLWRTATQLLTVDQRDSVRLTFKVKLPKGKDAAKVEFTAYAFNEDRIKSEPAKGEWTSEQISKLTKAQSVKPKVYLLSIGVNETGSAKWILKYASNDARQMQKILGDTLAQQDRFEVVRVSLISERLGEKESSQASKENIKALFDRLAGREVEERILSAIPNAKRLQQSTPDDIVIITFSSHGFTDHNGVFYIVPSGVSYNQEGIVRSSLVSSEDLSVWMKDIEADKTFMIIDSCYSADFTGKNFKPGPMGSRGLGQLAYNKKIRILTAAREQSYETSHLGMSVLSYVLLKKGLEKGGANSHPTKDHNVTFRELMEYAEREVPRFYEQGRIAGPQNPKAKQDGDFLQRPYLFDFVRDGSDLELSNTMHRPVMIPVPIRAAILPADLSPQSVSPMEKHKRGNDSR
jgi:WD40 repeat protein/uncharacterized caspase-like protein